MQNLKMKVINNMILKHMQHFVTFCLIVFVLKSIQIGSFMYYDAKRTVSNWENKYVKISYL